MIQDIDGVQIMPMETPVCGVAFGVLEVALIVVAKTLLLILIAHM